MSLCNLCPRQCGADRQNNFGFCKSSDKIRVARASLHLWEEPCISGKNGAGTVFFSGCNLGCVYCQNKEISCGEIGEEVSSERLRSIFLSLIEKGAHNIELVTPTHYIPQIKEALYPKLPVPVIYNSGGYDSVSSLHLLDGLVDVYMPDMKYSIPSVAEKYSRAADYPDVNRAAIEEMYRQVGDVQFDQNGLLKKGVLVRHLILPANLINTKGVLKNFSNLLKSERKMLFSLMAQYTPHCQTPYPELSRVLNQRELESALRELEKYPQIEGYTQDLASAKEHYIPDFDLSGVK